MLEAIRDKGEGTLLESHDRNGALVRDEMKDKVVCDCKLCVSLNCTRLVSRSTRCRHRMKFNTIQKVKSKMSQYTRSRINSSVNASDGTIDIVKNKRHESKMDQHYRRLVNEKSREVEQEVVIDGIESIIQSDYSTDKERNQYEKGNNIEKANEEQEFDAKDSIYCDEDHVDESSFPLIQKVTGQARPESPILGLKRPTKVFKLTSGSVLFSKSITSKRRHSSGPGLSKGCSRMEEAVENVTLGFFKDVLGILSNAFFS